MAGGDTVAEDDDVLVQVSVLSESLKHPADSLHHYLMVDLFFPGQLVVEIADEALGVLGSIKGELDFFGLKRAETGYSLQ